MLSNESSAFLNVQKSSVKYSAMLRDGALPDEKCCNSQYDSFSDVGESQVWFASKNLTPCRMH